MTFNDDSNIKGGRVSKRARNTGIAAGGGGILVVVLFVISQVAGVDLTGLAPLVGGSGGGGSSQSQDTELEGCETGADANENVDCRMQAAATSLDLYWEGQVSGYTKPQLVLFDQATSTGCGDATSAVGPFYCPPDQTVYLDTTFFEQMREQFGTTAGPLAQLYIVGHEWGHHIQQLTGTMDSIDRQATGPTSDGVRLELQADCYAGGWLAAASTTEDSAGVPLLEQPTDAQIADAISAAAAVGDDRIQASTGGQVQPETWTHGSSEQRQKWFMTGFTQGVLACTTFDASDEALGVG